MVSWRCLPENRGVSPTGARVRVGLMRLSSITGALRPGPRIVDPEPWSRSQALTPGALPSRARSQILPLVANQAVAVVGLDDQQFRPAALSGIDDRSTLARRPMISSSKLFTGWSPFRGDRRQIGVLSSLFSIIDQTRHFGVF